MIVANPRLNDFERALIAALLDGSLEQLEVLRSQFASARALFRELSGAGFFLNFAVPDDAQRVSPANFEISDVYFDLDGTECGGGAVLFIRNGVVTMLEAYSHGGGWPDEPTTFRIHYFDGETRDMANVAAEISSRARLR